jgi:hypothetical protein
MASAVIVLAVLLGVYAESAMVKPWASHAALLAGVVGAVILLDEQRRRAWCSDWGSLIPATVCVGFALGVGSYFRHTIEPMGMALTGVAVAVSAVWLILRACGGSVGTGQRPNRKALTVLVAALLLTATTFQVITLPYRYHRSHEATPGRGSWISGQDSNFNQVWKPDELWTPELGWKFAGRPNTACHVEPELCREFYEAEMATETPYRPGGVYPRGFYQEQAIKSFLSRPHAWLRHKAEIFPKYWFAHPGSIANPQGSDIVWNLMFLVGLVGSLLGVFLLLLRRCWFFALLVFVCLGFLIGPPVLTAFEARYFYPVKFAGFAALPLILGVVTKSRIEAAKGTVRSQ